MRRTVANPLDGGRSDPIPPRRPGRITTGRRRTGWRRVHAVMSGHKLPSTGDLSVRARPGVDLADDFAGCSRTGHVKLEACPKGQGRSLSSRMTPTSRT
jgi:hypothetical protein